MEWMFMPLKRYAEFSGRSRRQEFWMFMLLLLVIWMVAFFGIMVMGVGALSMAGANADGSPRVAGMMGMVASMGIIAVILGIVWLALLIPTLAVQVRRLHDTDRSGWWIMIYWGPAILSWIVNIAGAANQSTGLIMLAGLCSLLALVASIVLLVFYCLPGTNGPNQYGPDPLGGVGNLSQTFQ
jgi:uncharacterized membrane protein YhaH (DUF805 family)